MRYYDQLLLDKLEEGGGVDRLAEIENRSYFIRWFNDMVENEFGGGELFNEKDAKFFKHLNLIGIVKELHRRSERELLKRIIQHWKEMNEYESKHLLSKPTLTFTPPVSSSIPEEPVFVSEEVSDVEETIE